MEPAPLSTGAIVRARIHGGRTSAGAGRTHLSPGDTIDARVVRDDGRFLVLKSGSVRFEVPRPSGDVPARLMVRVLSVTPAIRLLLRTHSAAGRAGSATLNARSAPAAPAGDLTATLTHLLDRTGRGTAPGLVGLARTWFAHLGDHPRLGRLRRRERVALAAEAADRLSEVTTDASLGLSMLEALIGWPADSPDEGRRKSPERAATAADLSEYLRRAVVSPDHPLQLVNALRTEGALHWVTIPVGVSGNQARADGAVRIAIERASGAAARAEVDLTDATGARWQFLLVRDAAGQFRLNAWDATGPDGEPVRTRLPDRLVAKLVSSADTVDRTEIVALEGGRLPVIGEIDRLA